MDSRTIIQKVIDFDHPPRIGFDFSPPDQTDFVFSQYDSEKLPLYSGWSSSEDYIRQGIPIKSFKGSVKRDEFGNYWGRVHGDNTSKGEVIMGSLAKGYDFSNLILPKIDSSIHLATMKNVFKRAADKYKVACLSGFVFAYMRYARNLDNFLCDIVLEKDNINKLGGMVINWVLDVIDSYKKTGADAIMFLEDWGMQDRLMISPKDWRVIFKPYYIKLCNKAHSLGMKVIMHSCGYIYDIMKDLVEAGIDVFQLDQLDIIGIKKLSYEFGGKVTFFSPVDVQNILPTGNKKKIQMFASDMINMLGSFNGGLIARDYGDYNSISVDDEWAGWAKEIFLSHSYN